MFLANEHYLKLPGGYLFARIKRRVAEHAQARPGERVISLGIGDVTRPLAPAVVEAMQNAAGELGSQATFRGYGPDHGYHFLLEKIAEHDYRRRGVQVGADEIFLSDGAKSDSGCIGDILSRGCKVAVCDPVYPVYVDASAMDGRAGELGPDGRWSGIAYMPCTPQNGFVPDIPDGPAPDVIYLCYPNNPTGGVASAEALEKWVGYALSHGSLILYDAAYESFVTERGVPRSIFEIDGAQGCAIEFKSFSKVAGFTGVRCGYAVVPKALRDASGASMNALWARRQSTKMNGVSYVVQRGAEAVYSDAGRAACQETIGYYMENARLIREGLGKAGFALWGGVNAPYVWMQTPRGEGSWAFFERMLSDAGVVGTPGGGFGPSGEGFFRLTAFSSREDTAEAVSRIVAFA